MGILRFFHDLHEKFRRYLEDRKRNLVCLEEAWAFEPSDDGEAKIKDIYLFLREGLDPYAFFDFFLSLKNDKNLLDVFFDFSYDLSLSDILEKMHSDANYKEMVLGFLTHGDKKLKINKQEMPKMLIFSIILIIVLIVVLLLNFFL
ncbi:MAG: hypothetical protein ACTSVI_13330 [Promethearchaeota archaeon]